MLWYVNIWEKYMLSSSYKISCLSFFFLLHIASLEHQLTNEWISSWIRHTNLTALHRTILDKTNITKAQTGCTANTIHAWLRTMWIASEKKSIKLKLFNQIMLFSFGNNHWNKIRTTCMDRFHLDYNLDYIHICLDDRIALFVSKEYH